MIKSASIGSTDRQTDRHVQMLAQGWKQGGGEVKENRWFRTTAEGRWRRRREEEESREGMWRMRWRWRSRRRRRRRRRRALVQDRISSCSRGVLNSVSNISTQRTFPSFFPSSFSPDRCFSAAFKSIFQRAMFRTNDHK